MIVKSGVDATFDEAHWQGAESSMQDSQSACKDRRKGTEAKHMTSVVPFGH